MCLTFDTSNILPNADFTKFTEVSHVVNAYSRSAFLNTPNQSGRITRSDVGEETWILEDRIRRGGVEVYFLGGEKAYSVAIRTYCAAYIAAYAASSSKSYLLIASILIAARAC